MIAGDESGTRGRYLGPELTAVIERIGADPRPLTVVVGAGASIEAELPSWPQLVEALVSEVAAERLPRSEARGPWREAVLQEGLLAASAIARALSPDDADFVERLRQALYRGRPTTHYLPQALAQQVAWLKREVTETTIVTANYDGLLEQAMRDVGLTVHSYVRWRNEAPGSAAVYHVHGRLVPAYPATGRIVLSEDDYAQVQYPGSWQERFMRRALDSTLCVFVGLSLSDPNLIRWLYRYAGDVPGPSPHVALFVRQATPTLDPDVRRALEEAARARWRRCGVEPVWADFFGESAQFLHEVALLRARRRTATFAERAAERLEEGQAFLAPGNPDLFRRAQDTMSPFLGRLLDRVRRIAGAAGVDLSSEELGLGLWAADHARGTLTCWVTADRRFNDTRSLVPQPLAYASPWVAVQAVTRGVVVQQDPNVFASRWRLIRGIPLVVEEADGASRSIVGALTLTSMTPEKQSQLAAAPRGLLRVVDAALSEPATTFFAPAERATTPR